MESELGERVTMFVTPRSDSTSGSSDVTKPGKAHACLHRKALLSRFDEVSPRARRGLGDPLPRGDVVGLPSRGTQRRLFS